MDPDQPLFALMETILTSQPDRWDGALRQTRHDFYHLADYHRLAEEREEGVARLYVFSQDGYTLAMPLLLRPMESLAGLADLGAGYCDATSVYGYAGPACSHASVPPGIAQQFRTELEAALTEAHVVAAFSRLHPLFPEQGEILAGLGTYEKRWRTASIDLTGSPEQQLAVYRKSHRREIRILHQQGFEFAIDPDGRYLDLFIEIYAETMRRLGAAPSYLFDRSYFDRLLSDGRIFHLLVAKLHGEVVSGAMFALCNGICQYHLSGTRDRVRRLAPNKLILDEARVWAREQGAQVLHLGGGHGGEDSLFHFKAGFSDRRHDFATWSWVVRPRLYEELVTARERTGQWYGRLRGDIGFFPLYRYAGSAAVLPSPPETPA